MQLDQAWVMQQGEDAMLLHGVDRAFGTDLPARIGIAVSGGGDSVALLHLFVRWSAQTGHPIAAVTVDHGLRSESRAEAEGVAHLCRSLGVPHDILTWQRPDIAGNLAAAGRNARYDLMAQWAQQNGIGGIALGHTIDDTAENFLIRLGRSAGLDGLAEMQARFVRHGITWVRPLWQQSREALRAYLRRHDVPWVEDPSNDDPKYMRTRARTLLPQLAELGIDAQAIHHSAYALRQAQSALAHYTRQAAAQHVVQQGGDLLLPAQLPTDVPPEIERRLTVAALQWVGSNPYPPRKIFAGSLGHELMDQPRTTQSGCLIMKRKDHFHITREYNAVKDLVTATDVAWDQRWRLIGPHAPELTIRALGKAVAEVPDWRACGMPRQSLMASPAIWRGDTLIAAPVAGWGGEWTAQIFADFTSFLLSH
ncbi:tRNA lysidine(34) synthetase TilS [Sulfitobacter sp. HNIBRBA2951]|uniref:tRNA lysidine(34) synthetase TilS n=1 Tax=Sulfitobacter aquimarinus TaxID=3158557 RepID=UPI0032DFC302